MSSLTYNHFFILSLIVFIIGCFGLFLNRRNMINDTKALLESFGLTEGSNSKPNTFVVEKAFVD